MREITYRQALNEALAEELERDPNVFLMGEEVAEYNGAYKVTEGLWKRFGDKRLVDAPISEAAFVGLGVGASMLGLRPVIELMFWSFAYVAYDQIVNVPSARKAGAIRVIPGDPENSYLVHKIEGRAGIVGARMPISGPPFLTDGQILILKRWIALGAPRN